MEKTQKTSNLRNAFDTWLIASPQQRSLSFLLDVLLVGTLLSIFIALRGKEVFIIKNLYLWVIGMWLWEAIWVTMEGSTPGKKIFGLKVYSPRYDDTPSAVQVSLRIIMFWLGLLLCGLGLVQIFSRRDRRGWHDLVAETLVVGNEKSAPSPIAQKIVPGIQLVLTLIVFAGIGGMIFGKGLKKENKASDLVECYDVELFLESPANIFTALAISPAWQDCWSSISFRLKNVKDASSVIMAKVMGDFYKVSQSQVEDKSKTFKKITKNKKALICKEHQEYCTAIKELGSLLANNTYRSNQFWAPQHFEVLRAVSYQNRSERLAGVQSNLEKTKQSIVNSALNDRLWAEQVAQGKAQKAPKSLYPVWNHFSNCWSEVLTGSVDNSCAKYSEAYEAIIDLVDNDDSTKLEKVIDRGGPGQLFTDLEDLLALYEAKQNRQEDLSIQIWEAFSQISPIYKFAEIVYKKQ